MVTVTVFMINKLQPLFLLIVAVVAVVDDGPIMDSGYQGTHDYCFRRCHHDYY